MQEEGRGAAPNTLARAIFIQMFFAINWGDWQRQECTGFLMTSLGSALGPQLRWGLGTSSCADLHTQAAGLGLGAGGPEKLGDRKSVV